MTYTMRNMREKFPMPDGHRAVGWSAENPLYAVARAAGLPPEDSPIRWEMVFPDNANEPRMILIAPTWLIMVGDALGQLDQERQTIERRRKAQKAAQKSGRPVSGYYEGKADPTEVKNRIDIAVTDAATVLKETSLAAQTGFAVQLTFAVGREKGWLDRDEAEKVLEALRAEASRALGGV
jgi:hypothetical protein